MPNSIKKSLVLVLFIVISQFAMAEKCTQWTYPTAVADINTAVINEASGLEVSSRYPNVFYFTNDSGDGPHIYLVDVNRTTRQTQTLTKIISQFDPVDVEDLTLGRCPQSVDSGESEECLYVADIGDNKRIRNNLKIVVIKESRLHTPTHQVRADKVITYSYPDHARDAEGLAVSPRGDLFITTKKYDIFAETSAATEIFKLSQEQVDKDAGSQALEARKIGELDFSQMNMPGSFLGKIVTSIDITKDGKKILFLTYENALEVSNFDQGNTNVSSWLQPENHDIIELKELEQQETVAYDANDGHLYYTSESVGRPQSLYEAKCSMRQ